MTAVAGLLALAAVVFVAIRFGRRRVVAASTFIDHLIADGLAEIDLERWEAENGWAK